MSRMRMHRRRRLVLDIVGILMYKIVAEVRAADSSKRGNFSNPEAPQGGAAAASSRFAQTERRDGTPERAAQREDARRRACLPVPPHHIDNYCKQGQSRHADEGRTARGAERAMPRPARAV